MGAALAGRPTREDRREHSAGPAETKAGDSAQRLPDLLDTVLARHGAIRLPAAGRASRPTPARAWGSSIRCTASPAVPHWPTIYADPARRIRGMRRVPYLSRSPTIPAPPAEAVRECVDKWLTATLPPQADGQVGRVAARFALVAAAGELATALEILPWPAGEASTASTRWPPVATPALKRSPLACDRFGRSSSYTAPAGSRRHGLRTPATRPTLRPRPN